MKIRALFIGLAMLALASFSAGAYTFGMEEGLTKMKERADLICKARVVSSEAITNAAFRPVYRYQATATTLEIITVLKGDAKLRQVVFEHYSVAPPVITVAPPGVFDFRAFDNYAPQFYQLDVGRSYLIFAVKTETTGVFRHMREHHTAKGDEGVMRTLDARPVTTFSVKNAHWFELNHLLADAVPTNALYAISQLNQLSYYGDDWSRGHGFLRSDVFRVLRPLMYHTNDGVAVAALNCFNFGIFTTNAIPLHAADLIRLCDDAPTVTRRLAALRALSGTMIPAVNDALPRWLNDADPTVRAQAVRLLANFPGTATEAAVRRAADDESEKVRVGAAVVIGRTKNANLLPTLERLLADRTGCKPPLTPIDEEQLVQLGYRHNRNGAVRSSALYAMLQFDTKVVSQLLQANLGDDYFKAAIVAKFAPTDLEAWLPQLVEVFERKLQAMNWGEGSENAPGYGYGDCRNWLVHHLASLPSERFADGKLDRYLLALESVWVGGSHQAVEIYRLYRGKGLFARAMQYRQAYEASHGTNNGVHFDPRQ